MRHRIECWIENGLRQPQSPSDRPPRSIRWPRDSRLLKLALACCAASASGRALAQQVPAFNVAVLQSYSRHVFHESEGMLSFDTPFGPVDVSGQASYVIDGYDCWSKEWCSSTCAASVGGSVEFAIGPQSIVVSCSKSLPTPPDGSVWFSARVSGPTTFSWPGGSVTLDAASESCWASDPEQAGDYPRDCDFEVHPVAASWSGFPIVASAPFELLTLESSMRTFTPGGESYDFRSTGFVCEPYWSERQGQCLAPITDGSWPLIGYVLPACRCFGYEYPGYYGGALFKSDASFSVDGTRIDAELKVEWSCVNSFYGVGAELICRIGFDRPIRVLWDDACGSYHWGLIPNTCGPGSVEVWPHSYQGRFHYSQATLFQTWFGPSPGMPDSGIATLFRGSNIRFERMFPADVVFDGVVDALDISAILSKWGGPYVPHWTAADVNLDGQVGAEDLAAVLFAWGTPG